MENRDELKYSAMDIAKYAVNRQYKSNRPISNLQLQKYSTFTDRLHEQDWPPTVRRSIRGMALWTSNQGRLCQIR